MSFFKNYLDIESGRVFVFLFAFCLLFFEKENSFQHFLCLKDRSLHYNSEKSQSSPQCFLTEILLQSLFGFGHN